MANALRKVVDDVRLKNKDQDSVPIPFGRPVGELESLIEHREPRYQFKNVVLAKALSEQLESVVHEQTRRDWLREYGKRPARRVLCVGPPGAGKTMTAEALAGQLMLPLYIIRLESLITRYMGDTASKLRLIFDATETRRGVYLFDEFDAVGGERTATNDVAEMRRVLNSFLQFMEQENPTDSLIIGATNHPDILDKALVRRFDRVLAFDLPSADEIKRVLQLGLRPLKPGRLSWNKIVTAARGLSQSELSNAAEDVVKDAILHQHRSLKTDHLLSKIQARKKMQTLFMKQ
jgi:SpoVK/Ycf46/Vps4 family AAA+-type ATPase